MKYVCVPRELRVSEIKDDQFCFSPGRYVRFVPPPAQGSSWYAPLESLVLVRNEVTRRRRNASYRYAEVGDIDVNVGAVTFRQVPGYLLPTDRPARARCGDVLISKVRTYRKGIGLVTDDGDDLVTTNAVLNLCALSGEGPGVTLPYIFAFLRSDFFTEQVGALLSRGVYPRLDAGALDKILIPVGVNADVCQYVAALVLAILDKEWEIRARHAKGLALIGSEIDDGQARKFRYEYPTSRDVLASSRMDAGFWSAPLRQQIHRLRSYRHGAFPSIYRAGFTTRRGPNLAVSVAGPAYYSNTPVGAALPLATPGDISDFMTIPRYRYYGNRRRVDRVRTGEVMFAAKGVREVSIGHTWVNLGDTPLVTNFDAFLIHAPDRDESIFLAFFLSYLKRAGVFAKLSDTSNGGSFVQSHFEELPIPKIPDHLRQAVGRLYHNPAAPPERPLTLENFVAWHREWNQSLGIWEMDRERKVLQRELDAVQDTIIAGERVELPLRANHEAERRPPTAA